MRVALVTCEAPVAPDVDLPPLTAALGERGAEAVPVAWSDPGTDWGGFELALICSTWDYHERLGEFRRWLSAADRATRLRNPREAVEWNLDKRYLRALGGAGVPVVPTVWAEPGEEEDAAAEVERMGWDRLVVKPAVDLGAANLRTVEPAGLSSALEAIAEPALVQPFLDSVTTEGELSVVLFGGRPSHAVRKHPARGDFRVQEHHGGVFERVAADAGSLDLARRALEAAAELCPAAAGPVYARVDMVSGPSGPCVIELELIEPSFYLHFADREAPGRAADAIIAAAR